MTVQERRHRKILATLDHIAEIIEDLKAKVDRL